LRRRHSPTPRWRLHSVWSDSGHRGTNRYRTPDGKEETRTFSRKDARFIPRGPIRREAAVAGAPLSASFSTPKMRLSLNFDFRMTAPNPEQSTLSCLSNGEAYDTSCLRGLRGIAA